MKLPFFKKETTVKDEYDKKSDKDKLSEVFFSQLSEKRKEDPLIGAKIGSKEIFHRLLSGFKNSKGIHIETLMCVLGSLAGYSCQASLRRELIETKGLNESEVFVIVGGKDGNKYYFGELINQLLVANQFSVWSLAAGAVQQLGIEKMIDIREIFEYVSGTVGSSSYGIPRIPEGHKPGDIPYNYARDLWPVFLPIAEQYCAFPNEWPIMFGMAIQEGILLGKDTIDPLFALTIAMESAIPMAKVDLKRV